MTKCSFGQGDVFRLMGKSSEGIPSSTKRQSLVSPCQLRSTRVPSSTPVRSINPARSKFGLSAWAVTQLLARLLRQLKRLRSHQLRLHELRTGFRVTSFILRWVRLSSLFFLPPTPA